MYSLAVTLATVLTGQIQSEAFRPAQTWRGYWLKTPLYAVYVKIHHFLYKMIYQECAVQHVDV